MKTYVFFIYRPIATIIPLTILIVLNFFLLILLIPLFKFKEELIWVLLIPVTLITLFSWYVRKLLLIKVIAEIEQIVLKISYEALFIKKMEPTQIKISDIHSVVLKSYLGEEHRLKIKYGNHENQQISFIKSNDVFSVKDDFVIFSKTLEQIHLSLNIPR